MTAVANPPTFPQHHRPAWGSIDGNNSMNPEDARLGGVFGPRKGLARSNSSSSVSSNSSVTSTSTILTNTSHASSLSSQPNDTPSSQTDPSTWSAKGARKRQSPKAHAGWDTGKGEVQQDFSRPQQQQRPNGMQAPHGPNAVQGMILKPTGATEQSPSDQPMLCLLSLNGTFQRKTIPVPFKPDFLRIGRQTNQKTVPTPTNGFFDSKVLSRQHAEIFAERNGKVYIRDVKSSNGTFVNGTRLSPENRESQPHELQTGDQLELGIDIVSEDQKSVVHHKVAARVDHAGISPPNNVLDMNFGELDPANNSMMGSNTGMQMRGRSGSNSSIAGNGRMLQNGGVVHQAPGGMAQQRPFFLSPIATDQILKRLANEMRSARLQAQDLGRTNQFVSTLLSKTDVKDMDKFDGPEVPKPLKQVSGNTIPSFRTDSKARFSEPPAPPPQQPLPEKPDVTSSKRASIDRPRSGPSRTQSPRSEAVQQAHTSDKSDLVSQIESQTARLRGLESLLQKEREARELAEGRARELSKELAKQTSKQVLDSASVQNGAIVEPVNEVVEIQPENENGPETVAESEDRSAELGAAKKTAELLQSRIDTMDGMMRDLQGQLDQWKERCKAAELERDEDRKTLAEMVIQLREEEARRISRERKSRSRARRAEMDKVLPNNIELPFPSEHPPVPQADGQDETSQASDLELSKANETTPTTTIKAAPSHGHHLQAGLPYASGLVVVLVGIGLMAYINGFQNPPPVFER